MFNLITIIKPTILPSIRVVRGGLLFCEPNVIYALFGLGINVMMFVGYKCNFIFEKRNTTEKCKVYIHA